MRMSWALVIFVVAACGGDDAADVPAEEVDVPAEEVANQQLCADVVDADIEPDGDGTFTVSATVASADTGPEKYADLWEVRAADGTVLGERELLHPHVDEQPFTRSLSSVEVPGDVGEITVAARDSVEGFCGEAVQVEVP